MMKIPKKQELWQIEFNHSSDTDFEDFIDPNKNVYLLLVIDTTLVSDNPSLFRKNFWERILKRIMTFDHKIRDEKVQCNANREAEKKNIR